MNISEKPFDSEQISHIREIKPSLAICILSGLIGGVGIAFMVLHWPFGSQLCLFGFGSLCGYLLAISFFVKGRNTKVYILSAAIIISISVLVKFYWIVSIFIYLGILTIAFLISIIYYKLKYKTVK